MVVNRLSSKAITQSVIGDCAFLSAMALAAEYEARHHTNIISTDIYPQVGGWQRAFFMCCCFLIIGSRGLLCVRG